MNRKKVLEYLVSEDIPAVDLIVELLNKDETLIDLIIKSDSAKVKYELIISEVSGGYSSVIDVHFTDYLVEAMDIKDRWTSRGAFVEVNKITTERLNL